MTPLTNPNVDYTLTSAYQLLAPEAALVAFACLLFTASVFGIKRSVAAAIAFAALIVAALLHKFLKQPQDLLVTASPLLGDAMADFMRIAALLVGGILVLLSIEELDDKRAPEYFGCLLCATAGLSLVGAANDLIFMFLALELISIPTYVMLYLPRGNDNASLEASIKYFLLSILSSAFLLFGFSYLYGITGTTNIQAIQAILPAIAAGDMSNMALVAAILVMAGLGYRVTAFPFHFYAPDVYQGAAIGPVTSLAVIPKIAGFAALFRLFGSFSTIAEVAPVFQQQLILLLWILAATTMTVGNILALKQTDIRRLLAYSGVAHGGYMLIGLTLVPAQAGRTWAGAIEGGEAVLFYLVAYGAMTIGAFAVIAYLDTADRKTQTIDDLAGLHRHHPGIALLMSIFLFSLIGLPLTAGFIGKFILFTGALAAPSSIPHYHLYQALAVIGAANAAIGAYYYLNVLSAMYLRESFHPKAIFSDYPALTTAILCAVATIAFGIMPSPILTAAHHAFGR